MLSSNSSKNGVTQKNESNAQSQSQMAQIPVNANNANVQASVAKPGQQLLPNYALKLLKSIKVPVGTDRTMNGVDIDPTLPLIAHIIECFAALRDVNKIYRAKGSLASRSVGARVLFGFTAELGNLLLDAITFNPPTELKDAASLYINVGNTILTAFPEIAAQITKQSGKMLLHHTALKASAIMAADALKMVLKAYPAGAWTVDSSGALPLHWLTHNPCCNADLITILVNANPKGPWIADNGGYLPLHWSVNQPKPSIDVVAALLAANPSAASKPCLRGTLALHWCVTRDSVNIQVLKALLQVYADGARTFDDEGCLPLHRLVNRSSIDLEALKILVDTYPQALQCPNADGELPLHLAADQSPPDLSAIELLVEAYPGGLQVADDEGYLPLHVCLDCARPSPDVAKLLLKKHQQAAYHRTNDGLLPLHCVISSVNPSLDIVRRLLKVFPTSSEEIAVDLVPVDDQADPETWTGDWKKLRWTPLSRAIERRLDPIVSLFKAAMVAYKQQQQDIVQSSTDATSPQAASSPLGAGNSAVPPINHVPVSDSVNRAMDAAETRVMVGSELDESFDQRDKEPKKTPTRSSRPDDAVSELLDMISPSAQRASSQGAKTTAVAASPKNYRSTAKNIRRKNSGASEEPSMSTPGNPSMADSSYSQLDSFISNAESGIGHSLSYDHSSSTLNLNDDATASISKTDRDRDRRHRSHRSHRSHHHHRSSSSSRHGVDDGRSVDGDGTVRDKDGRALHAHHHHRRHHRSSSSHRSHSSSRHRESSRDREGGRDRDRERDRDRDNGRDRDEELPTFVPPSTNVHKTYLVPENAEIDDIDSNSHTNGPNTEVGRSSRPVGNNLATSQPKVFLDNNQDNNNGISAAVNAAAGLLGRRPSNSGLGNNDKLSHQVAVDIKLPAIKGITPRSKKPMNTKGYDSMDELV